MQGRAVVAGVEQTELRQVQQSDGVIDVSLGYSTGSQVVPLWGRSSPEWPKLEAEILVAERRRADCGTKDHTLISVLFNILLAYLPWNR